MIDLIIKEGDKIRMPTFCMGHRQKETKDYTVECFRNTLGIFECEQDRQAGNLTPLCNLYEAGAESKRDYISNYGEYITNKVPMFMQIPKEKEAE